MTNKKIKGLLFSTAILAALTGASVNTYASEIDTPTIEPAQVEYIAPENNETPAPTEDTVHIIEETEPLSEQEAPIVEPEVVEPTTEPAQETPTLSEPGKEKTIEEDNVTETNPAPAKNVESTPENEPTPVEQAPIVKQETEEENVVQNPEKVISQLKISASELNGAGNYQIKAVGTGKIVIFVGRKTVEQDGVTGEISGIYSVMVIDGKIDEKDMYLLSLAEDSYMYATGSVTFEINPVQEQEPIVELTPSPTTEPEEKEETPVPEPENPEVEQEKEKPTVEPKGEEKEVIQESVKGKYVGQFESEKSIGKTAEVHYDSESGTLNFKGTGYYFNTNTPAPVPIKLAVGQEKVLILDTMYNLIWEGNELVSIKAENSGYTSQDDEINDHLSKYPVFSGKDETDYEAEAMKKYDYLDIDDKNIREENSFYDAERLGFYYTNTSYGLNIEKLGLGASTKTAIRIKGIKLPSEFLGTEIFKREIGKTHYAYSFFKGSQRGGYDLVVIYFRLEPDGTLTVVRDFHSIMTKGARYADIFAKVELAPIVEPEQPVIDEPEKPTKPAPEEPKIIIEEEKVVEAKGKGVTPANILNVESVEKAPVAKPEKEDAAPIKTENVKADENEEDVPETGNTLVNSNILASIGVAISTLGTAIFKFRKK